MKCKFLRVTLALAALIPVAVQCYELDTHQILSEKAADASNLDAKRVLMRLGFKSSDRVVTELFPTRTTQKTVRDAIAEGAREEDVPAIRVINHFFDPITDRGLFFTSPTWATEDKGSIPFQNYSYKDARQRLFDALTKSSESERNENFFNTFFTLGHVIHHLQDMTQPQHVRADDHLNLQSFYEAMNLPSQTELLFEHHSRYEGYVDGRIRAFAFENITASQLPQYKTARAFWTNSDGNGIAQYVNRNYVSQGTNFQLLQGIASPSDRYALPVPTPAPTEIIGIKQLYAAKGESTSKFDQLCPTDTDCPMLFFGTTVSVRASSLSVFDEDLNATNRTVTYTNPDTANDYTVDRLFSLNNFTFDDAITTLLPKAVSYSAGLLNFFFRGELQISLPADGVYSIVDHAVQNTPNTSGFRYLRAKVKNLTPREMLNGGNFYAIAKFHLNLDYKADLSGEYGIDEMSSRALNTVKRSTEESLLLSAPIAATLDAAEGSQPEKTFTFDFGASSPIPINATDLVLQVVYRGQMGDETDGIAVATKDLAEPTYVGIMNSLDFDVGSDGKIFKVDPPPPPRNESIGFSTDATAQPIAFVNQLAVGEFARAAILVDPEHYLLHCKCDPQTEKNLNDSAINAVDESNPANILTSRYRALRGAYLGVLSSDWTYTFNFVAAYYGERPYFLPLNGPQDSVLVRISKTTDPVVPLLKLKPFTTMIDYSASPNVVASVAAPKGADGEHGVAVATLQQVQSTDGRSKSGRRIAPINPVPAVTQSAQ